MTTTEDIRHPAPDTPIRFFDTEDGEEQRFPELGHSLVRISDSEKPVEDLTDDEFERVARFLENDPWNSTDHSSVTQLPSYIAEWSDDDVVAHLKVRADAVRFMRRLPGMWTVRAVCALGKHLGINPFVVDARSAAAPA